MNSREEEEFLERVQRKLFATYICESIVEREACIDQGGDALAVVLVAKLGLERTEMLYARDADGNIYQEYEVVDCCPTVDLGQYVELTDECTYFITGEHPDTGDPNSRRSVAIPDSTTIEHTWRFKYQSSCNGLIEQVDQTLTGVTYRSQYTTDPSFPTQPGGFFISMKLRNYDPITDTESLITVPLSPSTAVLTGCAPTVNVADLTYNGSNGTAFGLAIRRVTENYLCTLGYVNGIDYLIFGNGNHLQSPTFNFKHLPASTWIGIRQTGQETETDAFVYDQDGMGTIINRTGIAVSISTSTSNLTRVSPCGGNVVRSRSFTLTTQAGPNSWRNLQITGTPPTGTNIDTQQTCSANIYDFTPPECEGEDFHLWQFQDGGWVTVQEGETRFEGLDSGDYRLQYNCDGCAYNYYFTVT
jgi:hypothetical protein